MTWFLSDDLPEIPADILDRLERDFDRGDCFDVAEAERERSSVRRLVAIIQKMNWRVVELQTDLNSEKTNAGYMRDHIKELVRRQRSMGFEYSHKQPKGNLHEG